MDKSSAQRLRRTLKLAAQAFAAAVSILTIVYAAGLARTRDVHVVFLDTSALAQCDFGIPGFKLAASEREQFEQAIGRRLEEEYSHWNVRFTFQRPAGSSYKVLRFLECGSAQAEPPLGFSLAFWNGEGRVYLAGGSMAPLARDTALQVKSLRSAQQMRLGVREALLSGRIHTLADCYGSIAAHELAHSFGVIGHNGRDLMAAQPNLYSHLGVFANWMIAISLG